MRLERPGIEVGEAWDWGWGGLGLRLGRPGNEAGEAWEWGLVDEKTCRRCAAAGVTQCSHDSQDCCSKKQSPLMYCCLQGEDKASWVFVQLYFQFLLWAIVMCHACTPPYLNTVVQATVWGVEGDSFHVAAFQSRWHGEWEWPSLVPPLTLEES